MRLKYVNTSYRFIQSHNYSALAIHDIMPGVHQCSGPAPKAWSTSLFAGILCKIVSEPGCKEPYEPIAVTDYKFRPIIWLAHLWYPTMSEHCPWGFLVNYRIHSCVILQTGDNPGHLVCIQVLMELDNISEVTCEWNFAGYWMP